MFLTRDLPPAIPEDVFRIDNSQFEKWSSLNDTIMGGSSHASCSATTQGLLLKGILIEQGGGFVSCRSPVYFPPLNLSSFRGVQLEIEGEGRVLKFGISCKKLTLGLSRFVTGDVRWVASVPTNKSGLTSIRLPFNSFEPSVRARPVLLPLKFDPSCIEQFQLLHSKFGQPGKMNSGFRAGPIKVLLRSINAYF